MLEEMITNLKNVKTDTDKIKTILTLKIIISSFLNYEIKNSLSNFQIKLSLHTKACDNQRNVEESRSNSDPQPKKSLFPNRKSKSNSYTQTSDTQPSDTQPSDTQPSDTQPSDTQPSTQPSDTQPSTQHI
jgi:hypothetical protein